MSWSEICQCREFRGRWVALDECRYDEAGEQPCEAHVVDVDDDLAELCTRIRNADRRSCAIVFCDDPPAPSARPPAAVAGGRGQRRMASRY